MITSGSSTPGVSPDDFGLPPYAAMRVELPRDDLADYVASYHVFDSDPPPALMDHVEWELPAGPIIRFALTDAPMSTTLRRRRYDPIPEAGLWGATSRAKQWTSSGGVTIGAVLTPLGWAALFRQPASAYRDQIVPLETILPAAAVHAVVAALRRSDCALGIKPILDAFFSAQMARPVKDELLIRQITALLHEREPRPLMETAVELGIEGHRLRRTAERYFGFPPKMLQNRTRFLRTIVQMILRDEHDFRAVTSLYYDASHWLRDAHRFLGMTPRQFMAGEISYLRVGLRAHAAVIRAGRQRPAAPTGASASP